MKKLFIVVNVDWFFLSHRKDVALAAKKNGWDVTVVTANTGKIQNIKALGLRAIDMPMSKSGMNILEELKTFRFLLNLLRKEKPDVTHFVGAKPNLYGPLAAKMAKIKGVVIAVSGRGVYVDDNKSLLARAIQHIMRFSMNRENALAIFQNHDDERIHIERGIIREGQSRFIKGSGVDLNEFCYTPEPEDGKIKIILTARMLPEKGIFVLTEAAECLRQKYNNQIEFWLVGGLDDRPGAITEDQLKKVCDGEYIKWLGYRTDVKQLLQQSHIVAFPSYYLEGLPKSLIEATAIGRPIITTDSVGCKDTVDDGINGFIIPPKKVMPLVDKLEILINDKELRYKMGIASRKKAEKEFSIDMVIKKHLDIYSELLEYKRRG